MTAIAPMGSDPQKTARERTEKWLEGVYKQELGRDLGEEGRKYWTDDIHDRGQTREEVIANIRRSPEYDGYNRGKGETPPPIIIEKPGRPGRPGGPGGRKPKPRWTPNPDWDTYNDRKYGVYDAISAASSAGNRMTDDYYGRFLPEMRNSVMLGINEIGAADRYHGRRYEGTPPEYMDPEELFKKYRNNDDDASGDSELEKRIKELEDKYKNI